MPKEMNTTSNELKITRRNFFNKLWLALGMVALLEFVGLLIAFLRPRPDKSGETDSNAVITAGPVDGFVPDTVTAFIRGRFYLARLEDGGFLALARTCTHLECTVPWVASEKKFICPCHSSAFDMRGVVIRAPAPRPLDVHPVVIENNMVKVDCGKRIKRSGFRAEQVTYPDQKA
jgi:cytochrome b6-f complex iron-sulfur subunit